MSRRVVEALERRVLLAAVAWHRAVSASERAHLVDGAPAHQRANDAEDALRKAARALSEAQTNEPS